MEKVESLKEIERRAYRSVFEDGIYDILWGAVFLIGAIVPTLDAIGISRLYGYAALLILPLIPWIGKRFITIPRLGSVEFGPKRKSRGWLLLLACGLVVFLQLPIFVIGPGKSLAGNAQWTYIFLMAAPAVAIGVIFVNFPRWYIYLSLMFLAVIQSEILAGYVSGPLASVLCFGLPAVAILSYGCVLLANFIRKYPKSHAEVAHVSR